jgi:hypothetical protein
MSSFRDQQKYLEALKKYERQFSSKEAEDYKLFLKRQKDDEDFDTVSMSRLKELFNKYNKPIDKSKYDHFFKKDTNSESN